MRRVVDRQRERIRELEAQLGLARAQAQDLADEIETMRGRERTRASRVETERDPGGSPPDSDAAEREATDTSEPRPVLRLYGTAAEPASEASADPPPLAGPPAPATVEAPPPGSVRLPVVTAPGGDPAEGVPAIPRTPVAVSAAARADSAEGTPTDEAVGEYRRALRQLSERRYEEALRGFEAFLREHPGHPYADNSLYWRGEIHYARRDYRRALSSFSELVERFPDGNKVPEALLRIGLCYERMGNRARATGVFRRLRRQYPDSVAARLASQEDA